MNCIGNIAKLRHNINMRLHYILRKPSKKAKIQIALVLNNPKFQRAVLEMRTKWHKEFEANEFKSYFAFQDDDQFVSELMQILKISNLHSGWLIFVGDYVINNFVDENFNPDLVYIEERDENELRSENKTYYIRIFPTTNKEDLLRALGYFKKEILFQKQKLPRVRPFKKLERDSKIVNLRAQGKTRREINKEISPDRLDKGHMGKVISKFKKRMKI
jgi:hypothetical protein